MLRYFVEKGDRSCGNDLKRQEKMDDIWAKTFLFGLFRKKLALKVCSVLN